jgi:SH3-like domain-containing protein
MAGAAFAALTALAGAAQAEEAAAEDAAAREAVPSPGEEVRRGPVTHLPLPRYVSLRADSANARRGPSLSHRVDWEFQRRGWPLQITAEHGHWRRVRDVEGAGGWMHHSLLSGVRTAVVVGHQLAPLYAGQGENTAVRAFVEPGVVARFDRCDGDWCRVSVGGTEGWAARERLWGVD